VSDSLEKLAAEGRVASKARDAKKSAERRSARARKKSKGERLAEGALVGGSKLPLVVFALGTAGMAAAFFGPVRAGLEPPRLTVVSVGGFAGVLVLIFLTSWLGARRIRQQERARLQKLPYDFDLAGYLGALSKERMQSKVTVHVTFDVEPSGHARELIEAAANAGDVEGATFSGSELRIRSRPISTYVLGGAERRSRYTNGPVHGWVRRVLRRNLRAIHARHPIRRVRVRIG
jgi:hypothetical protein